MTQLKLKPRAREALGVKIGPLLDTGPLNAITDVPRLRVGMVQTESVKDYRDKDYARSGITCIGTSDIFKNWLYAGTHALQGSGEVTGGYFIEESGSLTGPLFITTTQTVGNVHTGVYKLDDGPILQLPVVAETFDRISNPSSYAMGPPQVKSAYERMKNSKDHSHVPEGNVGGGAPMCSFGLKGGTGTSSRLVPKAGGGTYVVGALIQANHGVSVDLSVDGVQVGRALEKEGYTTPWYPDGPPEHKSQVGDGDGSIIVVIATDAPLLPHQCKALARRAGVGVSRGGGGVGFYSGDIFIAFSTALPLKEAGEIEGADIIVPIATKTIEAVADITLSTLFRAAADATEEAILNALVAAEPMQGYTSQAWRNLPVKRVRQLLKEAGRDLAQ